MICDNVLCQKQALLNGDTLFRPSKSLDPSELRKVQKLKLISFHEFSVKYILYTLL
jgi:hypothetical protein